MEGLEEAAHKQYVGNIDLKHSSYQFFCETNPTPEQWSRGPLWGVRRFSNLLINGRCTFNTKRGVRCGRRTVFGTGHCWQHSEDKRHLKNAPYRILRPKVDRHGQVMHTLTGQVMRESTGKGVFADEQEPAGRIHV